MRSLRWPGELRSLIVRVYLHFDSAYLLSKSKVIWRRFMTRWEANVINTVETFVKRWHHPLNPWPTLRTRFHNDPEEHPEPKPNCSLSIKLEGHMSAPTPIFSLCCYIEAAHRKWLPLLPKGWHDSERRTLSMCEPDPCRCGRKENMAIDRLHIKEGQQLYCCLYHAMESTIPK